MLKKQLKIFSDNDIFYCIWKNIHNYKFNIEDPFDLDIYLDPNNSKKAFTILENNGWIRVINPVAEYNYIRHYYYFSIDKIYHLHIYSGLRTGDSWLKNYYFPLNEFIKKNAFEDSNKIFVLSDPAYYLIFLIRFFIKNSTYFGRILYKNSYNNYNSEITFIESNLKDLHASEFLEKQFIEFINLVKKENISYKNIPTLKEAKRISKIFNKYLIVNTKTIFIRHIFSLLIRLFNKLFIRLNKVPIKSGMIVVLYGSDGCGKSSLANSLARTFSKVIPTKRVHLGKPFISNKIFKKYLYSEKQKQNLENNKKKQDNLILNIFKSLFLSFLRLFYSYIQLFRKQFGMLIISDRWPAETYGAIDSPKKFYSNKYNYFIKLINFLNLSIYKFMPKADLAIYLDTDLDIILSRNKNRNNPEPEEFIKRRFEEIRLINIKAKNKMKFRNNKELKDATNDCLYFISKFINQ